MTKRRSVGIHRSTETDESREGERTRICVCEAYAVERELGYQHAIVFEPQ